MTFMTQVQGIPCQCLVTAYTPAQLDRIPVIESSIQVHLFDLHGRRSFWLERNLQIDDLPRLADEFEASLLAEKYNIHF